MKMKYLFIVLLLLAAACGSESPDPTPQPPAPPTPPPVVDVRQEAIFSFESEEYTTVGLSNRTSNNIGWEFPGSAEERTAA